MKNKPGCPVPSAANDNAPSDDPDALERAGIEKVLDELEWNIEASAASLGYDVETLKKKMHEFGLSLN